MGQCCIVHLPDDILLCLADPLDISRHVQLSSVCHGWRVCLNKRLALSCLPIVESFTDEKHDTKRDRAMVAVLSHCVALQSLSVACNLLTDEVLATLGTLPCASTLRSLYVFGEGAPRIDRVLASLPALVTLCVEGGEGFTMCHLLDMPRHAVRELALACVDVPDPRVAVPDPLIWTNRLAEMQCLRLRLPTGIDNPARTLAGLRAAVPYLHALDLRWSNNANITESDLVELLKGATALRELSLHRLNMSSGDLVHFVCEHLVGLETFRLHVYGRTLPYATVVALLGRLPRLREADFDGSEGCDRVDAVGSFKLCALPALERLRLRLRWNQVKIVMPTLRSLVLGTGTCCMIDCSSLEELAVEHDQLQVISRDDHRHLQ